MVSSHSDRVMQSVQSILEKMLELISCRKKEDISKLHPLLEDARERMQRWVTDISELRQEHATILKDFNKREEDAMARRLAHVDAIQHAAYQPHQFSRLLTFLDCYISQRESEDIVCEARFATRLVTGLLNRVDLNIETILVFADGFFVYDAGKTAIFTIPYSCYRSYEKWVNLAHEVAHLYLRHSCTLDTDKLGGVLVGRISKHAKNLEGKEMEKLFNQALPSLIGWLSNWADEIASDCIAVYLCGIGYMYETILHSFESMLERGSKSHPPTDLRLACQIEIVERMGVDVSSLEQFRKEASNLESDPIMDSLTELNLAPLIVDWLLEHDCISSLESSWSAVSSAANEYNRGQTPPVDIDIAFGALAYLARQNSVDDEFEWLRRQDWGNPSRHPSSARRL